MNALTEYRRPIADAACYISVASVRSPNFHHQFIAVNHLLFSELHLEVAVPVILKVGAYSRPKLRL